MSEDQDERRLYRKQIEIQISDKECEYDVWLSFFVGRTYGGLRFKNYFDDALDFDLDDIPIDALEMLRDFLNYALPNPLGQGRPHPRKQHDH